MGFLRMIKGQLFKLKLMILSDAPTWLVLSHFKFNYLHRLSSARQRFKREQDSFRKFAKKLQLDNDWFTSNIPTWLMAFQKQSYSKTAELNCMEIGSWQGQSAVFLLSYFEKANLTCVDTWEGSGRQSPENLDDDIITFNTVEKNFDKNIFEFQNRVIKNKIKSRMFFKANKKKFDFIYVDGSHYYDDLLTDAKEGFETLKKNSYMLFDDYDWKFYKYGKNCPSSKGMETFINAIKKNAVCYISISSQCTCRKVNKTIKIEFKD